MPGGREVAALLAEERERLAAEHPRSRAAFEQARRHLLGGVPITPFHDMALMSPAKTEAEVDRRTAAFAEAGAALAERSQDR